MNSLQFFSIVSLVIALGRCLTWDRSHHFIVGQINGYGHVMDPAFLDLINEEVWSPQILTECLEEIDSNEAFQDYRHLREHYESLVSNLGKDLTKFPHLYDMLKATVHFLAHEPEKLVAAYGKTSGSQVVEDIINGIHYNLRNKNYFAAGFQFGDFIKKMNTFSPSPKT